MRHAPPGSYPARSPIDESRILTMAAVYRFGDFSLHCADQQLFRGEEAVPITARACAVLRVLVEQAGHLVSKDELLLRVWVGVVVEENNLAVQVGVLRKLLGPTMIATVPGRGYRFTGALLDAIDAPAGKPLTDPAGPLQPRGAARHLSNLPGTLPPLYGRAADLPALRALLASHRCVSVVGAGGIGKTALAQALAHEQLGLRDGGVWWVELAPLTDPALVAPTVVGALRGTPGDDGSIEACARALGDSRLLIVLDNCEHLLQHVAEVATALLRAAPNLRLLATSQEALKVAEEQVYRLGPLPLPEGLAIDAARQAGAVALFEARARAADPRFALNERNVADVVEICRRLDGIALAIELAAARVPLLGVAGLRSRLDERFQVLTGGSRLALQRHQTLRAALAWSHGLLTPDERTVLRRLGVFVGSFGLESAQQVAAAADLDGWGVLDGLGGLVDKSLVVAETGTEPRYRLLETTRAFALERLHEAGETEAVQHRHAQALLAVFEASLETEYLLPTQARIERYRPDLDNARAALDWSAAAGRDPQLHIALAGTLAWIWLLVGQRPEGLRRTGAALAMVGAATPPQLEARLLTYWPGLTHPVMGAKELAAVGRAADIYRRLGDQRGLYRALCRQSKYQGFCGLSDASESTLQEAARLFRPEWPQALRSPLLHALANLHDVQGRYDEAIAVLDELCRMARAQGDRRALVLALINQEQAVAAQGRLAESVDRGRELMAMLRDDPALRSGNEHFVMKNLLMSLTRLGAIDEALELAQLARPPFDKVGGTWELLDPCALIAVQQGRHAAAAQMLGRADAVVRCSDTQRENVEKLLRDTAFECLGKACPEAELARWLQAGEALSDDEALDLAFAQHPPEAPAFSSPCGSSPAPAGRSAGASAGR